MPVAERIYKTDDIREGFRRSAEEHERDRRAEHSRAVRAAHPFPGWLLDPVVNLVMFFDDLDTGEKGFRGERIVGRLLGCLPPPWCYLNDVVFDLGDQSFMQIDHIAAGPGVVAVIETKNWRGAVLGTKDDFRRKV